MAASRSNWLIWLTIKRPTPASQDHYPALKKGVLKECLGVSEVQFLGQVHGLRDILKLRRDALQRGPTRCNIVGRHNRAKMASYLA
jgi:hypothetical protein